MMVCSARGDENNTDFLVAKLHHTRQMKNSVAAYNITSPEREVCLRLVRIPGTRARQARWGSGEWKREFQTVFPRCTQAQVFTERANTRGHLL